MRIPNLFGLGLLLASVGYATPQLDNKKSIYTKDGSVVELVRDSADPLQFYRLPSQFRVAKDELGFAVQVIEATEATTYDFTWRAEDWSRQVQEVQQILEEELGAGVNVRIISPVFEALLLDQELFDGFDAEFENFTELGPFLPDSLQTLRLTIPKKFVSEFRKALVQGSGFFLPLRFNMILPDPNRPEQLVSLPYTSTLFLGGLSACALNPSLYC